MNGPDDEASGEHLVEPSRVDPQAEQTRATLGTKLFVLFFFLVVPPLGIVLVVAMGWTAYRMLTAG
jgi:hypothetical protein